MHSAEGIECVEVFLFLEVSLNHSLSQIIVITTALVRGYVCGGDRGGEDGRGRYSGGGGGGDREGDDGVKVVVRVVVKVMEMLVVVVILVVQ